MTSSTANGEEWLVLRVKDSSEPDQRVPIRLYWQVQGLTFWQRWARLILSVLAIASAIFIAAGYIVPRRFPKSMAVAFAPERQDLDDQMPQPVSSWKGIGVGFYRNARAFLHADYRLSGKPQGALASLHADKGRSIVKARGTRLFRETMDGEWEEVSADGRRASPGDVFRIGDKGPYFRISTRGGNS